MTDNPQYSEARPGSQEVKCGAFTEVDRYVIDEVFPQLTFTDILLYKVMLIRYGTAGWTEDTTLAYLGEQFGFHPSTLHHSAERLKHHGLINYSLYSDDGSDVHDFGTGLADEPGYCRGRNMLVSEDEPF